MSAATIVTTVAASDAQMSACKKGRYAPPIHMIKLTQEREITPSI
jgi:hypothetical protein